MIDLKGKKILITGACGYLGLKFSYSLATHGAQVILVDRDISQGKSLFEEFGENQIKLHEVNLNSKDSINEFCDLYDKLYDNLDVLVNNAAVNSEGKFFEPFETSQLEEWHRVFKVNLDAAYLLCQHFCKTMKNNNSGKIINISSIYGFLGPDNRIYEDSWHDVLNCSINTPASYAVSKAGLHALTKYLACILGAHNIQVNTLAPGGVNRNQNEVFQKKYSQRVPMGRMAEPEEIIGPLLFLCSSLSSYVTGQAIMVDGGLSAW